MYIGRLRYTKINIYQYIVSNIHSCLTSKPSDLECEGEPETVLVRQVHHGDVHQVLQCRHVRRLEHRDSIEVKRLHIFCKLNIPDRIYMPSPRLQCRQFKLEKGIAVSATEGIYILWGLFIILWTIPLW